MSEASKEASHEGSKQADIGVTGLAVMGRNLARNLARHGHTVALHNRIARRGPAAWSRSTATRARSCPSESLADFVAVARAARGRSSSWSRPARPTDAVIDELVPLLDEGDIVIDCGNAHFTDTRRREAGAARAGPALRRLRRVRRRGGRAATGPSIMPGGSDGVLREARPDLRVDRGPGRRHAVLRARRPGRRRALREDGAQRHRVRRHAAHRRGLRPAARTGLGAVAGRDRRDLPRPGTRATSSRS